MGATVSILIPVIRPEGAARCIAAITEGMVNVREFGDDYPRWANPDNGIEVEIIAEEDTERIGCPRMVKRLADKAKGDWLCFLGDDTIPQPGWLEAAFRAEREATKRAGLSDGDGMGLIALNDGKHKVLATHWLMHRYFLCDLENKEPFFTGYHHNFCDAELTDIALEGGTYCRADDARIVHDHPACGGEGDEDHFHPADEYEADQILYWRRKRTRTVEREGFRLGIGLPVIDRQLYSDFALSFMSMLSEPCALYLPKFPGGEFLRDIAAARNNIVEQALRAGCTHLAMMDTDQVYPPDCLSRLVEHAKAGWDMVGVRVHRRWPPFDVIMMRGEPGKYLHMPDEICFSGRLEEVDATGTGCLLINTEVFLDVPRPWFELTVLDSGRPLGEDIGFCAKARALGKRIAVDTSIEVGHITQQVIGRQFYELYKKLKQQEGGPPT